MNKADARSNFEEFVASNLNTLVRIARSLTGDADAADDLTQLALEKAYRSWAKVMLLSDPLAYVRRILVNSAYDSWRRKKRFRELFGAKSDAADLPAQSRWGNPELSFDASAQLDELLRPLTERERAVITLRFLVDLSEAATADELGIAVGTVKSTTARALNRMRSANPLKIGA
ncbi:SigE family RNA polymerase sigma factor [Tessaracoccus sp. OH4464_COT-324]|uniref:SigE family RNA polymerase sigma factor n=1 Tax=Tessaracoccus sp. OH4464_COT-324 TaxID=2491059 RepID=UPI000F642473|nr:SigE family RNA polymerase sigma factor [Tessaracoccus sp. OH4464_COT-324]RRD46467.1 SigE family RNA polymerase sigma factor [Tessaracoccus sp. OH4464_COT-324]